MSTGMCVMFASWTANTSAALKGHGLYPRAAIRQSCADGRFVRKAAVHVLPQSSLDVTRRTAANWGYSTGVSGPAKWTASRQPFGV
jgi:hypothetical protein